MPEDSEEATSSNSTMGRRRDDGTSTDPAPPPPIWYRESPNGEKFGPISLEVAGGWLARLQIPVAAQFSFDDGQSWETLMELCARNGPYQPFLAHCEGAGGRAVLPGYGSIEEARKLVAARRSELARLERARDELQRGVEEREQQLQMMKAMERELEKLRLPQSDQHTQTADARQRATHLPAPSAGTRVAQGPLPVEERVKKTRTRRKKKEPVDPNAVYPQSASFSDEEEEEDEDEEEEEIEEEIQGELRPESLVEEVFPTGESGRSSTTPEPAAAAAAPAAPAAANTSVIPVPRPSPFPMLQPSTLPNDYKAAASMIKMLRDLQPRSQKKSVQEATRNTFEPPPRCTLCPEGAVPLADLSPSSITSSPRATSTRSPLPEAR